MGKAKATAVISADARQFFRVMGKVKSVSTNALKTVGGLAITGAVFGVREAVKFSKAMAQVNTIARLGAGEFAKLKDDARAVAVELGADLTDTVNGLYQALSAGVSPNNAVDFLRVAGKAAIAGATDVTTAVDGLTSVMNAYGIEQKDVTKVADVFFETVRLGKTEFPPLAQNIGKVITIARDAGIGFEELFSSIATMTKQGAPTNQAFTALRGAIKQLVKPGDALQEMLLAIGFTSGTAAIESLGLLGTLDKLSTEVGGDINRFAQLFTEVEGLNAVMSLTGKSSKLAQRDFKALGAAATGESKAMSKAFETMKQDVSFQIGQIKALGVDAGVGLGSALIPALSDILKGLQAWAGEKDNLQALADAMTELAGAAKTVAGFFGSAGRIGKAIGGGVTSIAKAQQAVFTEEAVTPEQIAVLKGLRAKGVSPLFLGNVRSNLAMQDAARTLKQMLDLEDKRLPAAAGGV